MNSDKYSKENLEKISKESNNLREMISAIGVTAEGLRIKL